FRWLPLFHLVLALCAAEVLQLRPRSPTAAASFLLLFLSTIAVWIFQTQGEYGVALLFAYFQIAAVWVLFELFLPKFTYGGWSAALVTFAILLATYFCIPPNCGVPKYHLGQELLSPAPLDPQRLYLSIYPEPESAYRLEKKKQPIGQLVRPGSTSMWAGLTFINGYSPILPAGIAREFDFRIHGEINQHEAEYLVWDQSNPGALLEQVGIDGLVVAWDSGINPALGEDWEFVTSNDEAAVYHRTGPPFERVRSVQAIDSHPNEQFSTAAISEIQISRNKVSATVSVPGGGLPAMLTFSRPFFRGYKANLGREKLAVESYHGLFPAVGLSPGAHGRLVLSYEPSWLIIGGACSMVCALIWLLGFACAARAHFAASPTVPVYES
ncbi:MAG TPA: hypothetical protein VFA58_04465, partial [Chthoniobacterales bacterium]|nr:hypothetical protein [Chthoniobacterales bacterium]